MFPCDAVVVLWSQHDREAPYFASLQSSALVRRYYSDIRAHRAGASGPVWQFSESNVALVCVISR